MQGFVDGAQTDLIINGRGDGPIGADVASGRFSVNSAVRFDPGILRPVIQTDGKRYCLIETGRTVQNKEGDPGYCCNKAGNEMVAQKEWVPVQTLINNGILGHMAINSALPYLAWQDIDRKVLKASRDRLVAWADLSAAETYGGFDGMATTGLIRDTMTDAGDAKVSMEKLDDDLNDSPLFTPDILPLPIIHAGSSIPARRLATSRNSGMPLDTTAIEQSGRRVAETLEKMTIGMEDFSGLVIGDDTTFTNNGIYGYRTHPDRITYTKTALATAAGWSGEAFLTDVLGMKEAARAQNFYGPFVLYYSTSWDQYLGLDYRVGTEAQGLTSPTKTVLQRIQQIQGISQVKMLDRFTGVDELLLVQMGSGTIRAVSGMDFTTVRWQRQGDDMTFLRVLGIKVPDIRSQYVGTSTTTRKTAIVHAT